MSGSRRSDFPAALPRSLPSRRDTALYRRVFEVLRRTIAEGVWAPGASLPSEAALGTRFKVSRITIRQALQLLQIEGYIRTQRARRAIVLSRHPLGQSSGKVDTIDELIQAASDAQLKIRSWRSELAPEVAQVLGVPPGTDLRCLRSLLSRDGRPVARSIIYFHPSIGERLRRQDFDDVIVFRVLRRELGVQLVDVKMTVWAELAESDDVAQLGCKPGTAMLCTRLVYRGAQGLPVEVALTRFPAALHRVTYSVDVQAG
ncbi:MAG: GntR family transcriptional regulator [Alphaproteobacteria bacterium]|nr:GntR family transcriptional regulator [Alphaproteobacteria bacterium]